MQPEKALYPIIVTLLGILMEVRLVQPLKAPYSMLVTLLGISMEVSPVQPSKAEISILVTLLGIWNVPLKSLGHLFNVVPSSEYSIPNLSIIVIRIRMC